MAFTNDQLNSIANSAMDFFFQKGSTLHQAIQRRPLLDALEKGGKSFPGGKGDVVLPVQFVTGAGGVNDGVTGYTHNDTVTFYEADNVKQAKYPWREHHLGFSVTHTQLKMDGLSVSDSGDTSAHSGRDVTVLVNMFQNKLEDFAEQYARGMNTLMWGDGTGDSKALAGVRSMITANPTTGTVGGINRATAANKAWRNRARTAAYATAVTADNTVDGHGGGAVTSSTANGGALWQVLQEEKRQLRRYGGNPNKFYAGSDFIGALETEMRANGYYSQNGFRKAGDGAMGPMLFDGTVIEYDPTLDDLGLTKRGYWFDTNHIYLAKMAGEWRKQHKPARPANQFVLQRSITSTGQLVAQQLNSALVIDIT